jgi:hypothetical protein
MITTRLHEIACSQYLVPQQGGLLSVQKRLGRLWSYDFHFGKSRQLLRVGGPEILAAVSQVELCHGNEAGCCAVCDGSLAGPPGPSQKSAPFRLVYSAH